MKAYASRRRHFQLLYLVLAVSIFLSATGCSARLKQFKDFSEAGVVYSDAMVNFTDAAGTAAIDADSLILKATRPALSRSVRSVRFRDQNDSMKGRLAILDEIKDHTLLLKAYFEALGALAGSDIGTKFAGDTNDIVSKLGKLNPRIAKAKIGGTKISSLVKPATDFLVQGFQTFALERELKSNGKTIAEALRWQEAAVGAITQIWQADR